MTIENKAIEAYVENSKLAKKYQVEDEAWLDWYTKGYQQSEIDFKEKKDDIRIHINPNYYGNRKYYFTKDDSHCLSVEYNPNNDFGIGNPSGARLELVEIHTNNGFIFGKEHKELDLDEVPECILELLSYLK